MTKLHERTKPKSVEDPWWIPKKDGDFVEGVIVRIHPTTWEDGEERTIYRLRLDDGSNILFSVGPKKWIHLYRKLEELSPRLHDRLCIIYCGIKSGKRVKLFKVDLDRAEPAEAEDGADISENSDQEDLKF